MFYFCPSLYSLSFFFHFHHCNFSISYCKKWNNLYRFSGSHWREAWRGPGIILPPSRAIRFPRNVKINYSARIILCNPAMSLNNLIRGGARRGFGARIIMSCMEITVVPEHAAAHKSLCRWQNAASADISQRWAQENQYLHGGSVGFVKVAAMEIIRRRSRLQRPLVVWLMYTWYVTSCCALYLWF